MIKDRNRLLSLPGLAQFAFLLLFSAISLVNCKHAPSQQNQKEIFSESEKKDTIPPEPATPKLYYIVPKDIRVKDYFRFITELASSFDTLLPYRLDEYLIARSNPALIDSFIATDYYSRQLLGEFVYDQSKLVVLHQGDSLLIPDSSMVADLVERQKHTYVDINIPEYRLRIVENGDTLYSFLVRVGQHKKKYWAVTQRMQDLRTKTGEGEIIWINRNPKAVDPQSGKKYDTTRRDDGKRTKMPQIPWLEPSINSHQWGQMIHPTTNPVTLGKAYSNGCIGLGEADAWRVYFYAPVGTKVVIRYDLQITDEQGATIMLPDVYDRYKKRKSSPAE